MITLTREEVQQVLDALGSCEEDWIYNGEDEYCVDSYDHALVSKAFELLRARLSAPEPDDEGLYTETQVQKMRESFEQSVTDPENQPSQYGTVPMKEWQGLTDEEIKEIVGPWGNTPIKGYTRRLFAEIEAKLKEKNA